ncbi:hypothetical protein V6N12_021737 [Hibiscus sabdariffa]|uniref:Fringe-like glycosyltransferase domain-containing protein n=1 Tax=Hibiscus sabdariffa TaxID=183260 RepID=A0ABR2FSL1_9ROSI
MLKFLRLTPSRIKDFLLIISLLISTPIPLSHSPYPPHHTPRDTRAVAFLDQPLSTPAGPNLPPVVVSSDTRLFPYTFKSSLRSAIRVARVVKEAVDRNETGIRWFVYGDDDTVFVVDNLVEVLSKYDHDKWYYVGSSSESYEQNVKYSCLMRYGHLYGSDSRILACLVELGVGLTHEPGFHQVDVRGNVFGMLTAHPLSPLLPLHHLDAMEPIFPNMDKTRALEHFFKAVTADSSRILQQTVCYENFNSLTVSVAWGYAIQVYEGNQLLPDLLSLPKTFSSWKRGTRVEANFMFNTREYPRNACERPLVFYLESVVSDNNVVWSNYTRHSDGKCRRSDAIKHLKEIRVVSQKLELDIEQMMAPRRQCCEISASHDELMVVNDRKCGADELISMNVVYSCLTELGVGLTREPGFHQFDVRGNAYGLLAAHPLTPLVSLHHIDHIDPIFPNMTTTKAMQHFHAAEVDSQRILQQTICYDRLFSRTVSVSWGYAIQVYNKHIPLPDVLPVPETFRQWKWGTVFAGVYTFNTIRFHPHPCHRPTIFFLVYLLVDAYVIFSCIQMQAPRRHCCDVLSSKSGDLLRYVNAAKMN